MQKEKSIKLSFCSLLEQNGMVTAPFHSLELGQDAGRSALLRSCKDHRLPQHSLLAFFSLCLPSCSSTGIFLPFPPCSALSQAPLGKVNVGASICPVSCTLQSLVAWAGHGRLHKRADPLQWQHEVVFHT